MAEEVVFEQRVPLKGSTQFVFRGNGEIEIHFSRAGMSSDRTIELGSLDPACVVTQNKAILSWCAGILFTVGFFAAMVAIWRALSPDPFFTRFLVCAIAGTPLGVPMVATVGRAIKLTHNVTTFSHLNGQTAFSVDNKRPTPQAAADFIAELTERIKEAAPLPRTGTAFTDQLAQLHVLRSRGVLTHEEFLAAKHRILAETDRVQPRLRIC